MALVVSPGCDPGHTDLGVPAGAGAATEGHRGPFQPQLGWGSVHEFSMSGKRGLSMEK